MYLSLILEHRSNCIGTNKKVLHNYVLAFVWLQTLIDAHFHGNPWSIQGHGSHVVCKAHIEIFRVPSSSWITCLFKKWERRNAAFNMKLIISFRSDKNPSIYSLNKRFKTLIRDRRETSKGVKINCREIVYWCLATVQKRAIENPLISIHSRLGQIETHHFHTWVEQCQQPETELIRHIVQMIQTFWKI